MLYKGFSRRKCHWSLAKVLTIVFLLFGALKLMHLYSPEGIGNMVEYIDIKKLTLGGTDVKVSTTVARGNKAPAIRVIQQLLLNQSSTHCYNLRKHKGFLTIGIPTIRRPNTKHIYLFDTLDSLMDKIPTSDYGDITIVVMFADENATYNMELSDTLHNRYKHHCNDGFIHVIQTNKSAYPDLSDVRITFQDSAPRLKWRAKQNIDFALLMSHSKNLSDYYLQLEDDVIAATDFVKDIRETLQNTKQEWFLLEFSRLGFIGKLFHSSDLDFSAKFLVDRYDEAPCDLLLGPMRVEKGQTKPMHVNMSLFQHVGKFSSLKNKLMPSIDGTFKDIHKTHFLFTLPRGDNPPAKFRTSLTPYEDRKPEMAYDNDNATFFWALTPKKHSHFTMIFTKPHNFSRIMIATGEIGTKRDSFLFCDLRYSATEMDNGGDVEEDMEDCGTGFKTLVSLVDGDTDTLATGTDIPSNIKCLRLKATKQSKHWIIIRDIQLFLKEAD